MFGVKMKKQKFKREFSAGGVVYRKPPAVFLLGKHSGYHKWVLPKGLIEKDEKPWETAIRETEEEMGVKATLVSEKPIHKETYFYVADFKDESQISNDKFLISKQSSNAAMKQSNNSRTSRRVVKYQETGGKKIKVFKTVTFYLLEYVSGGPEDHGWEMEEVGWFSYKEALKKLDFEGEKETLRKTQKTLSAKKM